MVENLGFLAKSILGCSYIRRPLYEKHGPGVNQLVISLIGDDVRNVNISIQKLEHLNPVI